MNNALIVLPTATMGGAERVLFNVAKGLLSYDYKVTLYVMSRGFKPGWEDLSRDPNFNIIFRDFSSEKKSVVSFLYNIYRLSRANKYDVVFSSHTHVNAALSFMRVTGLLRCRSEERRVGKECR